MSNAGLDEIATWVPWFEEDDLRHRPRADIACVFNQQYAEPLLASPHGRALSRNMKHLWVYHEMVRRQLGNVVVMEDNPVFRDELGDLPKNLQELFASLPAWQCRGHGGQPCVQGRAWRPAE